MLIKSNTARVVYSIAFGLLVAMSAIATGAQLGWALSLGVATSVLAFGAQTYYAKRSQGRK